MLSSAVQIIWPLHLQTLKLLVQLFMRRCIYKNVHYFTIDIGVNATQMVPSILYIMWPSHLQGFRLLRQAVKGKMHLQENTFSTFDLDLRCQGHTKCGSVLSTSCDLFTCKIWCFYVQQFRRRCIYKKIHYLTVDLDLVVKVTQNIAQYPLHYVTYVGTKFEVASSNGLGRDAFTRKYIIWLLTLN